MPMHEEYTGQNCDYGHPTYYQVLEIRALGHSQERRRGPTCWYADCEAHKQWQAQREQARRA